MAWNVLNVWKWVGGFGMFVYVVDRDLDVRVIGICSSIVVAVLFVVVGCGDVQAVLLSVVGCVLGLYSAVFVVGVHCVKRSDCIDAGCRMIRLHVWFVFKYAVVKISHVKYGVVSVRCVKCSNRIGVSC